MNGLENIIGQNLLGNSIRAYLMAGLFVVLGFLPSRALRWVLQKSFRRITQMTKSQMDDLLLEQAVMPLSGILFLFFCYAGGLLLHMPDRIRDTFNNTLFVIGALWWAPSPLGGGIVFRKACNRGPPGRGSITRLQPLFVIFKLLVGFLLLATTLDHIGFDVVSLITGLGIGGLAVAFAAQQAGNVLGSIQWRPTFFCGRLDSHRRILGRGDGNRLALH